MTPERWTPEMLDQFASRVNATLDRITERMDASDAARVEHETAYAEHQAAHAERQAEIDRTIAAINQQQVVTGQQISDLFVIVGDLANGLTGIQTEVRRLIERNGGQ
jgi:cell division septum initiation protein DivIVA